VLSTVSRAMPMVTLAAVATAATPYPDAAIWTMPP
jgi:hypothetical protein